MSEALMPRQAALVELAKRVVAVRNPNSMSRVDDVAVAVFQLRVAALALLAAVRDREAKD